MSERDLTRDRFNCLFGASTKKRGLAEKTLQLRQAILDVFEEVDKPVTVRQMFYLLTSCGAVPKTENQGYRRVQRQIVLMRKEHLIPYNWIADNTRWMRKPTTYEGLHDFFNHARKYYRQDLWHQSENYVEVWLEKDALAGVIYPITEEFDVPLMVTRGYPSESFVYEAAANMKRINKPAYIYYFGDLDPSGWHISQNLEEKLLGFGADIQFNRVTVNPEQVSTWNLPTRPTKKTDTRKKQFVSEVGDIGSIEIDAIHPDKLRELVRSCIEKHIDEDQLEFLVKEEAAAKETLNEISKAWLA
jgi:hypothetical protein